MARTKQTCRKSTGGKAPRKTVPISGRSVPIKKPRCIGCGKATKATLNKQFIKENVCRDCVRKALDSDSSDEEVETESTSDDLIVME